MDEVIDRLWVGDKFDGWQAIQQKMIVIGVGSSFKQWDDYFIPIYRASVDGNGLIINEAVIAVSLLANHYLEHTKKDVLIHCEEGIDRSPYVVANVIAYKYNLDSLGDAYTVLRKKHPITMEHYEWVGDD